VGGVIVLGAVTWRAWHAIRERPPAPIAAA